MACLEQEDEVEKHVCMIKEAGWITSDGSPDGYSEHINAAD